MAGQVSHKHISDLVCPRLRSCPLPGAAPWGNLATSQHARRRTPPRFFRLLCYAIIMILFRIRSASLRGRVLVLQETTYDDLDYLARRACVYLSQCSGSRTHCRRGSYPEASSVLRELGGRPPTGAAVRLAGGAGTHLRSEDRSRGRGFELQLRRQLHSEVPSPQGRADEDPVPGQSAANQRPSEATSRRPPEASPGHRKRVPVRRSRY